jgi:hypothetical protein
MLPVSICVNLQELCKNERMSCWWHVSTTSEHDFTHSYVFIHRPGE